VRIGIAISDPQRLIASPHATYHRASLAIDAAFFQSLVTEQQLTLFVVGLPVHMSGDESQKSTEARSFGAWLAEVTGLPVEFCDERFTSREADQQMAQARLTRKNRKRRRDMIAAQILLAGWLDRDSRSAANPPSLDEL